MSLAQGHNVVTLVRHEPAALRSPVKHSTTEPLRSLTRYGKCSKICNSCFLFSNKLLVFRAGIHKIDVRKANKEDPDQIWVCPVCLGCLDRQLVFKIIEHLLYAFFKVGIKMLSSIH